MTERYPLPQSRWSAPTLDVLFPTLKPAQIERLARYGQLRQVEPGEVLIEAGSESARIFLVKTGQIDAHQFVTHRFALDDIMTAYDVFAAAADTGALKVVLHRSLDS